jgi:hypothetical protein
LEVLIHDNYCPGQTRAISFDTNSNIGSYHASTNPNEPDSVYEGDAGTKTLSLFPVSTWPSATSLCIPGTRTRW